MSELKSILQPQSNELLNWLRRLPWPIDRAMVLGLTTELGWSVESDQIGFRFDTGYSVEPPRAWVATPGGSVAHVRVVIASSNGATPALRDLFADHVDLLTRLMGDPAERQPGSAASARWMLANGSAFSIRLPTGAIMCGVTSPELVQIEADLGRR